MVLLPDAGGFRVLLIPVGERRRPGNYESLCPLRQAVWNDYKIATERLKSLDIR
jgi:hypothetical protein